MKTETAKIGKRGTFVIPGSLRKKYGFADGSLVIVEERENGILIRPAAAVPVEIYSKERQAEFLLTSAITEEEYESAVQEVRHMGLDPDTIPHCKPMHKPGTE